MARRKPRRNSPFKPRLPETDEPPSLTQLEEFSQRMKSRPRPLPCMQQKNLIRRMGRGSYSSKGYRLLSTGAFCRVSAQRLSLNRVGSVSIRTRGLDTG